MPPILRAAVLAAAALFLVAAAPTVEPVRIALVFDFKGRWVEPKNIAAGLDLLVADRAKENLRPVEFIRFDSGDNATGTQAAMKGAIEAAPDAIIAEVHSSKALVAAEMAEKAGIVMVTTLATSPAVTEGKKLVFRATFSDDFQGVQLGKYAYETLGVRTAAIVADATQVYSTGLAKLFAASFTAAGGKIVADERILPTTPSFGPTIERFTKTTPELIFLPLYEQAGARFISEAARAGLTKAKYLGGDGLAANNALLDLVIKNKLELDAHWVSHYSGALDRAPLKDANERLTKLSGLKMDGAAAIGYDSGLIILTALDRMGWPKGRINQAALAQQIRGGKKIHGLGGTIAFDGKQDPQKSVFIRTIKDAAIAFEREILP